MAFRIKLPENKKKKADLTPRIFVIYGKTMEGKSYLANEFPEPIVLSTDTNAKKLGYPHIDIKPVRYNKKDVKTSGSPAHNKPEMLGKIKTPTHDILDAALIALANDNASLETPYETLIIDVVDDLAQYTEEFTLDYVNAKFNRDEQYLGDYDHGVAWGRFNNFFLAMVNRIHGFEDVKYIVWISRASNAGTENNQNWVPALRNSLLDKINGEGDFMIECTKMGENYKRRVKKKRKQIDREKVADDRIAKIMDTVDGAYRDLTREEKIAANQAKKVVKKKKKVVK